MDLARTDLPEGFLFGTTPSAYLVEGHGAGGAGPCERGSVAATQDSCAGAAAGGVACDHYQEFEADLDLVATARFDLYRLSISWTRVMPDRAVPNPDVRGPFMPAGWQDNTGTIAASPDRLGVNSYTHYRVPPARGPWPGNRAVPRPRPKTEMGLEIAPDRMVEGEERDDDRIGCLATHLDAVQGAIAAGVPLRGYAIWSLMDDYHWVFGSTGRVGRVNVDLGTRARTPKAAYQRMAQIVRGSA
ncbi:Glycosyl hydrolase family 1 [Rhodovulum sp. ES.010]|uniref:family 1 glycosylhydrolase n=1 Tax=Rhodovulum sp. ES.010 TaxID=1882821 RepID=UPI00092B9863|nr:family 1 glycosylhydrolase [Rhodovulum sp. ES.010]SIO15254.1 Glycosyl hydrolase family 1 [Rhodovulum sp. ES.010]